MLAGEELLTGRLQEITRQVHLWSFVYSEKWQIFLWFRLCGSYTLHSVFPTRCTSAQQWTRVWMASVLSVQILKYISLSMFYLKKAFEINNNLKTKPLNPHHINIKVLWIITCKWWLSWQEKCVTFWQKNFPQTPQTRCRALNSADTNTSVC